MPVKVGLRPRDPNCLPPQHATVVATPRTSTQSRSAILRLAQLLRDYTPCLLRPEDGYFNLGAAPDPNLVALVVSILGVGLNGQSPNTCSANLPLMQVERGINTHPYQHYPLSAVDANSHLPCHSGPSTLGLPLLYEFGTDEACGQVSQLPSLLPYRMACTADPLPPNPRTYPQPPSSSSLPHSPGR